MTKIGAVHPDRMYIVSAHLDSRNTPLSFSAFAPGADDDGSGSSLVIEAARVFAPASVRTDASIRFIVWDNEESGLNGSAAYVSERRSLQGLQIPAGSGNYPEPTWLGVLQHDMILFDHGLPVQPEQIPGADIDIEYQSGASYVGDAIDLAAAVHTANLAYATDYPAEVSSDMSNTDSRSFQSDCPSLSLRENRRQAEIGHGANPNWHQNSDQVATYSPADFRLGFNTVQTTVGAIAELAGAMVLVCGDGILAPLEQCDDGGIAPGDGCDPECRVESGWTCGGEPSSCAICRTDRLRFSNADEFAWDAPAAAICSAAFDVARGDLLTLHATGNFEAATCLDDDLSSSRSIDTDASQAGNGFWYLTRVDGDSWESLAAHGAGGPYQTLTACP